MLYQARFCSEHCQTVHTVMWMASALTTDPALRKQRKQKGGNTGKNFTEGWVEFEDKAVAKNTAAMLNGNPIGGKRRSAYHYDLWSLKYLPKFKWDHLTEEISKTPKAALHMLRCSYILQCTSCTSHVTLIRTHLKSAWCMEREAHAGNRSEQNMTISSQLVSGHILTLCRSSCVKWYTVKVMTTKLYHTCRW